MKEPSNPIKFWNPYSKREEIENVYGDGAIRFLYQNKIGFPFTELLSHPTLSKIFGIYQSSVLSRQAIDPFIKKFNISMDEYEKGPFKSFNDFFVRKFLPEKRKFSEKIFEFSAFAEGRYLAFERTSEKHSYPVKGKFLTAAALIGNKESAIPFKDGPIVIARLCPTDYHRFHFPDDGEIVNTWGIDGALHSVNPVALKFKEDIFSTNERQVTILKTKNFGRIAYIEVGAMCVGRIVQSFKGINFKRGEEKGYFLFGGSTVIVIGEANKWSPNQDLIKRSSQGLETYIHLGDKIASKS
jgi:phosphatidylserine decarboxylase